jgi:hypothetical protein
MTTVLYVLNCEVGATSDAMYAYTPFSPFSASITDVGTFAAYGPPALKQRDSIRLIDTLHDRHQRRVKPLHITRITIDM